MMIIKQSAFAGSQSKTGDTEGTKGEIFGKQIRRIEREPKASVTESGTVQHDFQAPGMIRII
jgi:hypothetical protein